MPSCRDAQLRKGQGQLHIYLYILTKYDMTLYSVISVLLDTFVEVLFCGTTYILQTVSVNSSFCLWLMNKKAVMVKNANIAFWNGLKYTLWILILWIFFCLLYCHVDFNKWLTVFVVCLSVSRFLPRVFLNTSVHLGSQPEEKGLQVLLFGLYRKRATN